MSRGGPVSPASRKRFRKQVDDWARRLRVHPTRVRIQPMRHKWGSCSASGTITLSTQLLRESAAFREYVVVHELLHLRVRNHGPLMKAYLTMYCPGWRRFERLMTGDSERDGATQHLTGLAEQLTCDRR